MRIGIDTGGTFTDFVFLGAGEGRVHKVPSTPQDPLAAIVKGLKELCPQGLDGVEVVHGTTVGTNAFLQRRGARVALLTTRGFEDVLSIGRQTRRELFNLTVAKSPELLPRERVLGVAERLGPDGRVLEPLTDEEITRVRRWVAETAPEALAIVLLHSYAHPDHEEHLAAALADLNLPMSLSSRVLPEFREYERTCATVLNAYLGPVLGAYLADWSRRLPGTRLFIQQSNGGFLTAPRAASLGLHTVLSGPAGGVSGALRLARQAGEGRLLTLDMGGTSTDVALLNGEIPFTQECRLQDYPLGIPVMDIHTVGAGGLAVAGELELRYPGQSHSLAVPFSRDFEAEFHRHHHRLYGHDFRERQVEAVLLRLQVSGPSPFAEVPPLKPVARRPVDLPRRGQVWLPQGPAFVPFYYGPDLEVGFAFTGPALWLEDYSTLLVLPGFHGQVLPRGNSS